MSLNAMKNWWLIGWISTVPDIGTSPEAGHRQVGPARLVLGFTRLFRFRRFGSLLNAFVLGILLQFPVRVYQSQH